MTDNHEKKHSVDGFFMRLSDDEYRCWVLLLKALRSAKDIDEIQYQEVKYDARRAG